MAALALLVVEDAKCKGTFLICAVEISQRLADYKFRAKFLELAKDAKISQKDWCEDILEKIDSKKIFKTMRVSPEERSKFIGLCERQLRPLYSPEKLGSSSLLDLSTPLPKNLKPWPSVIGQRYMSLNQKIVPEYDVVSENSNDLDSSVRLPTLSQTDYMSSKFKHSAKHVILMNRRVLMTARPNVAVSSKNKIGICFHGSNILMKVGYTAGYDSMGKTVRVAGFEADGRPFFETSPELVVRSEDGKRVLKIGYDANGNPIHARFDKRHQKVSFQFYLNLQPFLTTKRKILPFCNPGIEKAPTRNLVVACCELLKMMKKDEGGKRIGVRMGSAVI
ncbi:predicted protein [Sclerotinia sclerotiorum 1980 UF-70]|uniref:Uncharacterized protein n=1 Tax=Sclerotinia sclerotiorum (strain ATCC 18683 / 1980 / Ss-1) TaxID=665079 RepID=A7EVB3_SCLS1|nr:predicted protein [Sclerotinia sclerotiorum 1980 UF-70]EDN93405.1 predicted protein [Sclerotinia sclerotiorum 1980 UF-70]